MPTMADKVKALRAALGMTTKELGQRIGVHQSTVSKYEFGVQLPKSEPNQKLAELAGVTLSEWLGVEPLSEADVRARLVMVVGEIQAGYWREAIEWDHDSQFPMRVPVDPETAKYQLQGYIVRGPSMNKIYPDGHSGFYCLDH